MNGPKMKYVHVEVENYIKKTLLNYKDLSIVKENREWYNNKNSKGEVKNVSNYEKSS